MERACSITLETLLDYNEKRLDTAPHRALEQHLATGCAGCQETLAWLSEALPALAPLPAPSPEARAFTRGLARLLPTTDAPAPRVPLIARLLSGGAPVAALAGARGAQGTAVQRLYETDSHLITLWDEADGGTTRYLIGQIYDRLHGPLVPQAVVLFPTDGAEHAAQYEGSEFHAAGVPPGSYLLRCTLENAEIFVPGVEVGR